MPLIPIQETRREIMETLDGRAHSVVPGTERSQRPEAASVAKLLGIGGQSVEPLLRRRRATRKFSRVAPAQERVRKIITAAYAVDRSQWYAGEGQELSLLLTTSSLPDVPPGLHLCDSRDGAPSARLRGPDLLPALHDSYVDAPALLFVCGDVRAAAHDDSGTGYGALLMRAGALGYALWLAAVADGLAGCVYGRPSAAVTAAARELGPGMRHLFTVALGVDGSEADGQQVKHGD